MTTTATQPYSPPAESRPGPIAPAAQKPAAGELAKPALEANPYAGLAVQPFSEDACKVLSSPIPVEDLDILPTGEVYASQVRYRRRLNEAFGAGGWGLLPRGPLNLKDNVLYREYALLVGGRFVAEAVGECEYQPNNKRMTYASAAEAVKSNALTRCCKDLGIAAECWDRHFTEQFRRDHCIQVWGRTWKGMAKLWRLKSAEPFEDEKPIDGGTTQQRQQPQQQQRPATARQAPPRQQPAEPEAGGFDDPSDAAEPETTNPDTGAELFRLYDDLPTELRTAMRLAFRTGDVAELSANIHQAGQERSEAVLTALQHAHRTKLSAARLLGWIGNYHAGRKEPKPATFAEVPPHAFQAAARALEKEPDDRFAPKAEPAAAGAGSA